MSERWSRGVGRSITFTDRFAPVYSRASCLNELHLLHSLNELHMLHKSWWNHNYIFGQLMFCTPLGIRLGLGLCVEHFQEGAISISRLPPLSFSSVVWFALAPPLQQKTEQPSVGCIAELSFHVDFACHFPLAGSFLKININICDTLVYFKQSELFS